jgi:hypothetical protein
MKLKNDVGNSQDGLPEEKLITLLRYIYRSDHVLRAS